MPVTEPTPFHLASYTTIPFVILLLCIAILPIYREHWWSQIRNQAIIVALCSAPILFLFIITDPHPLAHAGLEYVSFIVYVGSLFIISGGIFLKGDILATPRNNTLFLAVGAVLANIMGTAGASLLLIRPLLTTNQDRRYVAHIPVFFIFIVSNIGGLLTPLGDPPLFLGFLRGVPFTWTLQLWPQWLLTVGILLIVFYLWDSWAYRQESAESIEHNREHLESLALMGKRNFFLLGFVLANIAFTHEWVRAYQTWGFTENAELAAHLTRDGLLLLTAIVSYLMTPSIVHERNEFSFHALEEVAVLFFGLFITMIPALLLLQARGAELGITTPLQFFWYTGLLSGFLDNAPTYLSFTALAQGVLGVQGDLKSLIQHGPEAEALLTAISVGAVFMGAMTYIGNAPNFMVKHITEKRGLAMPSFGGYLVYSCGILMPIWLLISLVFFSGK